VSDVSVIRRREGIVSSRGDGPRPRTHRRLRRAGLRVLALLAALAMPVLSLAAQRVVVSVGDSARVAIAPGAKLAVPIGVDLAAAGSTTLASLQAGLTWGSTRLTFDSLRVTAASGFSLTPNLTGAASGSLTFNAFSASALAASGPLATAYFTATATAGGTSVVLTPTAAGSELGSSVLNALNVRNLGVCVAPSGKWGDVNDDGTVNIIDAQQIARSSVGLSVANNAAVTARGDVTADGTVNIIDAQQIARASVALSAAARVNTSLFSAPVVASVTLTPGAATSVVTGGALALAAVTRDSAGVDLGGCAPVTWSSSSPSVATVSSGGVVVAVATGSATITATSGTRSATVPITVSPPYVLAVTAAAVGGTSNTFLTAQPVVTVQTLAGAVVSAEVRQITATLASGSGSLSGTTTVSTVNGVATFTDLAITGTGAHTLAFAATGASPVTSSTLTVVAPTTMRLLIGATPSLAGTAATDIAIPLSLDLSGRGSQDLASVTAALTWDPAKYAYVSNSVGNWVDASGGAASVTVNATNAASGTLSLSGFTSDATTASFTLRTITLRPLASGPMVMSAAVSAAGNVNGQSVTVVPRNLGDTVTILPAPLYVPLNGLVRWWPLDGDGRETVTGSDGVLDSARPTTDRFGRSAAAVGFDGVRGAVAITNPGFNPGQAEMTMAMWVRLDDLTKFSQIFANTIPHNYVGAGFNGFHAPGEAFLLIGDGAGWYNEGNWTKATGATYVQGQWFHFAYTKTGTTYRVYFNGRLANTVQLGPAPSALVQLYLGSFGGGPANDVLKGALDDTGIWNRALTQEEITAMVSGTPP
jgi:hypothetical protein